MSVETVLIVLAVWTVVGLVVAIAFGHMVPEDDESGLASAGRNIKFFRQKTRAETSREAPPSVIRRTRKQRDASS